MTHPAPFPHGALLPLVDDVHYLVGSVRMGPGVRIGRTMTVLVHEGELTLVNAIRLQDLGPLEALGRVAHVVKIGIHGMDDAFYAKACGATRWALPGVDLPEPVERLSVDNLPVPWVSLFSFEHTVQPEGALLADRDGGVLITCDSVQNWPDTEQCSLLAKPLTSIMGFNARPAQIGPPWRKGMTPPGGSLKEDFERMCQLPFRHLVGGHGKPLMGGAKEALMATVSATFV